MERRSRPSRPHGLLARTLLLGLSAALFLLPACVANTAAITNTAVIAGFELTTRPRIAFAGQAVWVRCYAPQDGQYIRYGIEGVRISGPSTLERTENLLLVERLPCGKLTVTCQVDRDLLTTTLDVLGGECEAGAL